MKKLQRLLAMMLTVIMCVSTIGNTGIKVFAEDAADETAADENAAGDEAAVEEEMPADETVSGDEDTAEEEPTLIPENEADVEEEEEEENNDEPGYFNIWVGGVRVSTDNYSNIGGVIGKASYNTETNTLKLSSVTDFEGKYQGAYIYATQSLNITGDIDFDPTEESMGWRSINSIIRVTGVNNTLTLDNVDFRMCRFKGVDVDGTLKIRNNQSKLDVVNENNYGTGIKAGTAVFEGGSIYSSGGNIGMETTGNLTIDGAEVVLYSKGAPDHKGYGLSCGGDLIVKSGSLEMWYNGQNMTKEHGAAFLKGKLDVDWAKMRIPGMQYFESNRFWFADGQVADNTEICEDKSKRYPVWVNGIQLSEDKRDDIFGLKVEPASEYLSKYDPATKTLLLDGVTGFTGTKNGSYIYAEEDIILEGRAPLEDVSDCADKLISTSSGKNITIQCDIDATHLRFDELAYSGNNIKTVGATIDIIAITTGLRAAKAIEIQNSSITSSADKYGISAGTDITVTDSDVSAVSRGVFENNGVALNAGGKIALQSGNIKAQAKAENGGTAIQGQKSADGLSINIEQLEIIKPEGAKISNGTVLDANDKPAAYVETGVVTPYDVWVGNTRVTGKNYADVLGNGKVSYHHGSRTLELKDLTTEDIGELYQVSSTSTACIYSEQELQIVGTADLSGANFGIYHTRGMLGISGTFNIDVTATAIYGIGENVWFNIYGGNGKLTASAPIANFSGGVTVYKGDWELTSNTDTLLAFAIITGKELEIKGGRIKAHTDRENESAIFASGKIILSDTVDIYEPEGGKLSANGTMIVDKDGNNAGDILIDKMLTKYAVTFNANGHGTAPEAQNVREGFCAKDPGTLTASGWIFNGWDEEKGCINLYDFETPVTGPITLYAGWLDASKTYYKVEFDLNGHGAESDKPATQTIEEGKPASEPAKKPYAPGFIFKGWTTEKTGKTLYNFNTPVNADLKLYAYWEAETPTYTVTFDLNGKGGTAPAAQVIEEGKTAVVPEEPEDIEYVFIGWFTDEACTAAYVFTTPVTADITLYAGWTLKASALNPVPIIKAGDTAITLVKGQKFTLPALSSGKWAVTAKNKYVSVSKKGVLSAKKVTDGADVSITDGVRTVKITIVQPKFTTKTIKAEVTDFTGKPLGFDPGSTDLKVAYYCSSPDVVLVEGGQFIAVGKGSATVTAYVNGKAYNCKVSVKAGEDVYQSSLHLNVGKAKKLSLKGVKVAEWVPDTEGVVEINKTKITPKTTGMVTLKAKDKDGNILKNKSGNEYLVYVKVEDPTITTAGFTPNKSNTKYSVKLKKGDMLDITFAHMYQDVIFKSSKGEIAFADEYGNIRAQKAGKSKLTAKINKKTITINVTVE